MYNKIKIITLIVLVGLASFPDSRAATKKGGIQEIKGEITSLDLTALWNDPTDIASRNLFYGPGGEKDQPHGPFVFLKEDLDGSNVKFVIRDQDGTKWKVKLGQEVRSETAASRLVWAAGYHANEDYFLSEMRVDQM